MTTEQRLREALQLIADWTMHSGAEYDKSDGYAQHFYLMEKEVAKAKSIAREALSPPAQEGYVLVPVEPTESMLDAGHEAGDFHILHYDGTDKPGTPRYSLGKSWKAMLAAAQEVSK